jgi:hypothetical protein
MADKPFQHTQLIKQKIAELRDHMRDDVRKIDEAQAKALFETSAEVLNGIYKAFDDYEKKNEPAWQGGKDANEPDKPIGNIGPPKSGGPAHG